MLALGFALGVAIAGLAGLSQLWIEASAAGLTVFAVGTAVHPGLRKLAMPACLLLSVALGGLRTSFDSEIRPEDISCMAPAVVRVLGVVDSEVEESVRTAHSETGRLRFRLRVIECAQDGFVKPIGGLVRVSVPAAANAATIPDPGDYVVVEGNLRLPGMATNPGMMDERARLALERVHAVLSCTDEEKWRVLAGAGPAWQRIGQRMRFGVLHHLRAVLPAEKAALIAGVLFGSRSGLPTEERAQFMSAGLQHLLSTAGLHIGALIGCVLWVGRRLGMRHNAAIVLALSCGWLYAEACGGHSGTMRAVLMATVLLFARLVEREPDAGSAIGFSALLLLIHAPQNLFDPGFQISFATVITIAFAMPLWQKLVQAVRKQFKGRKPSVRAGRWLAGYITGSVAITITAQAGSFPIATHYFHTITPGGLFAGLLVMPLLAPIIMLSFVATVLGAIFMPLSVPVDLVLRMLGTALQWLMTQFSQPGQLSSASPGALLIIIYYGVLWGGCAWVGRSNRQPNHKT